MRPLIVIALFSVLLTACGQTGPLYLEKDLAKDEPKSVAAPQAPVEATDATSPTEPAAASEQPSAEVNTQAR